MRVLSCAGLVATLAFASACGGATSPSGPTAIPEVSNVRMSLAGSVRDAQDNAALPSVAVSVISGPDTGRATSTDASGNFNLGDLKVGILSVRFTRDGFMIVDRTINSSQDTHLDIQLRRGPTCVRPTAPANFRVTVSGTTGVFAWDYVPGATDYVITLRLPNGNTQTGNATVSPHTWRRLARGRYTAFISTRDSCGEGDGSREVAFTI